MENLKLNFFISAPNVTYNGSLLSGSGSDMGASRIWTGMESSAFRVIKDVEFEVRVGPFATDLQKCKLTCIGGQWVGPMCRTQTGKFKILDLVHQVLTHYNATFSPAPIPIRQNYSDGCPIVIYLRSFFNIKASK